MNPKFFIWPVAVAFLTIGFMMIVLGDSPLPRVMGFVVATSGAVSAGMLIGAERPRR